MATQDVEVELREVRIDMSAATTDPAGLSGHTPVRFGATDFFYVCS